MKKNLLFLLIAMLFAAFSGCSPNAPAKEEVLAKITGKFCSEDYNLTLTDSTYQNNKYSKGLLSGARVRESCKGSFDLAYEGDRWVIRFAADKSPQAIQNCKKEFTLWTQKDGYLIGEEIVTMRDLFDNTPLTLAGCEEDF